MLKVFLWMLKENVISAFPTDLEAIEERVLKISPERYAATHPAADPTAFSLWLAVQQDYFV